MTSAARACPACRTPLPEEAHFCLHCGTATPTEPGVPPRTAATEVGEVARVRKALADTYRVERVLGEGGMATVYLAEDIKHRRMVAIKVMRAELAATLGADRFLREVEIAAQLSHPHILPVHDSGEAGGVLYYVMPFVEGESLQERLRRETELPVEEAIRIAREVSDALAYAHRRKIVHRDIKPANILMSEGHAMVADFGIARAVGSAGGAAITKTGLAVGTPHYMSPEQASGSPNVDARADIYAVGCVLYEMVAGEPPFTGPTPQAIITRSLTETPRALATTREGLSTALDAVVSRALAKSPADRWQTIEEFNVALGRAQDTLRSGSSPVIAADAGPSAFTVWGLFGAASLVALAVVFGLVRSWGLPLWVLGLAVGLLAIGAVVLVTTGRMEARRRSGRAPTGLLARFTWKNAALGGLAALGLWVVATSAFVIRGPGTGGSGGAARLAVLPFQNRGAASDAYFVDGIADQVRGKLAALGGLLVTARTSSELYRDSRKNPQEIGRELGVDYLLAATVSRSQDASGQGGRVQVSPELIDVRTGASRWQQSFDGAMSEVFQVQGNIATQVAQALGVTVGTAEERELAERPTRNLAAYDAFLKGERDRITGDRIDAVRRYGEAVALDSTFALAWARSAIVQAGQYFTSPTPELREGIRRSLERAVALAPDAAITRVAQGSYYGNVELDFPRAKEALAAGLAREPNNAELLTATATYDRNLGRWEEALSLLRKAREVDPRSGSAIGGLATALLWTRNYPEAEQVTDSSIAQAPANLSRHLGRVMLRLAQGDLAGARRALDQIPAEVSPTRRVAYFSVTWDLFWALDDEQQALLLRLPQDAFDDDKVSWALAVASTYALRGDLGRASTYGDSARVELDRRLKSLPDDNYLLALRGLAAALSGRREEAIRDGERSLALLPISKDGVSGPYNAHLLARTYTLVGEKDKAVDVLAQLLAVPYFISRDWLRIDPTFAQLRGYPKFQQLLAGP